MLDRKLQGGTLALCLFLLLLRQIVWSFVSPLFQAPDEVIHLQMSALLDRYGLAFYSTDKPVAWRNFEESFDFRMDYYNQKGIIGDAEKRQTFAPNDAVAPGELEHLQIPVSNTPYREPFEMQSYQYPPLYYFVLGKLSGVVRNAGGTLVSYQFSMRLIQCAMTVLFYYLIAIVIRRSISRADIGWLVFLAVAFHPLTVFMGSVVNNDNGLLPSCALCLIGAITMLRGAMSKGEATLRTLLFYVAGAIALLLTKGNGFLYLASMSVPLALILFLLGGRALGALVSMCVIGGWGLERLIRFVIGEYRLLGGTPQSVSLAQFVQVIADWLGWNIIRNLFGQFGWFDINYPAAVYVTFILLLGVACVIGILASCSKMFAKVRWNYKSLVPGYYSTIALLIVGGGFAMQYLLMPKTGTFLQGRYMLAAVYMSFLAAGSAYEVFRSAGARRICALVLLGIVLLTIGGSAMGVPLIVNRFYFEPGLSWHALIERLEQYKPWYVKSMYLWVIASGYLIVLHVAAVLIAVRSFWGAFYSDETKAF